LGKRHDEPSSSVRSCTRFGITSDDSDPFVTEFEEVFSGKSPPLDIVNRDAGVAVDSPHHQDKGDVLRGQLAGHERSLSGVADDEGIDTSGKQRVQTHPLEIWVILRVRNHSIVAGPHCVLVDRFVDAGHH